MDPQGPSRRRDEALPSYLAWMRGSSRTANHQPLIITKPIKPSMHDDGTSCADSTASASLGHLLTAPTVKAQAPDPLDAPLLSPVTSIKPTLGVFGELYSARKTIKLMLGPINKHRSSPFSWPNKSLTLACSAAYSPSEARVAVFKFSGLSQAIALLGKNFVASL